MIVTLLAKTQLYELTIIAAYGDMYNYYRPVVPKLLIIVYILMPEMESLLYYLQLKLVLIYVLLISYR